MLGPPTTPFRLEEACQELPRVRLPREVDPGVEGYLCELQVRPVPQALAPTCTRRAPGDRRAAAAAERTDARPTPAEQQAPSRPPGEIACTGDLTADTSVWLRGSTTLAVVAPQSAPATRSGGARAAYLALTSEPVGEVRLRQHTTQLAEATGCPDAWDDVLAWKDDRLLGTTTTVPAPVEPGSLACSYAVEQRDAPVRRGRLYAARRLTDQQVGELDAALAPSPPGGDCSRQAHSRFAMVATRSALRLPPDVRGPRRVRRPAAWGAGGGGPARQSAARSRRRADGRRRPARAWRGRQAAPRPAGNLGQVTTALDPLAYRRVVGRFATGVTVITTVLADGEQHAMTCNSFTSVSLDPMLVLFCAEKVARFHDAVLESGIWAVSVLDHEHEHGRGTSPAAAATSTRSSTASPTTPGRADPRPGAAGGPRRAGVPHRRRRPTPATTRWCSARCSATSLPDAAAEPLLYYEGGYRTVSRPTDRGARPCRSPAVPALLVAGGVRRAGGVVGVGAARPPSPAASPGGVAGRRRRRRRADGRDEAPPGLAAAR